MNMFNAKLNLNDSMPTEVMGQNKIIATVVDNLGLYSSYDCSVGDIIYLDGSLWGMGLLRYKIVELLLKDENFTGLDVVAVVEWDMDSEPTDPMAGLEGIIGASHTNGLTANVTTSTLNSVSESFIASVHSYQTMILSSHSGTTPDISELEEHIEKIGNEMKKTFIEWE